jgi:hypothetical protein
MFEEDPQWARLYPSSPPQFTVLQVPREFARDPHTDIGPDGFDSDGVRQVEEEDDK